MTKYNEMRIILLDKKWVKSAVCELVDPDRFRDARKFCFMSQSHIFHVMWLVDSTICIMRFLHRRHSMDPLRKSFIYQYQFKVPDSEDYEHSSTNFEQ